MKTVLSMRPSEKLVLGIATCIFVISSFFAYHAIQKKFGVETPDYGGNIREGVVGNPRYVNPILAQTDIDKGLTNMLYSGLLKVSTDGQLIPDLAESWNVSENGLVYTVHMNPRAVFHDGTPVTADDVLFTINTALNPDIHSSIAANWSGVTVQKNNDYEIIFNLKKAYAPFAENLTLGILPKHIWSNLSVQDFDLGAYYQVPIGSGPFAFKSVTQSKDGFIETYTLEAFKKYIPGKPYINKIQLVFFKNQEDAVKAFQKKSIDTLGGISPEITMSILEENPHVHLVASTLPRIFALFFNQNSEPLFLHKEVRQALDMSVDKDGIIDTVLKGYGKKINSPLPAITQATSTEKQDFEARVSSAKQILEKAGWTLNASTSVYEKKSKDKTERLTFTISTSNSQELTRTAEMLKEQWTKIGADVKIETFDSVDLTQKVIRPRKYGALLFGQIVGRDIDLYPFWHSTQRTDPGLNIALYANTKANTALDIARSSSDPVKRNSAREDFAKEVANDIPAVFIFSPEYIYIQNTDIHTHDMQFITEPADHFININTWYTDTTYQWN